MDLSQSDATVALEFDEELYPLEAVYGAAYVFIDRCYVHLDRKAAGRICVSLRSKTGDAPDSAALAGEFENEILGQAWRVAIADNQRALVEAIASRAVAGAAGPPGLDELFDMDIGEDSAFEDPLGLAMSWEEKYKKKPATDADEKGEPQADPDPGEQSAASEEATADADVASGAGEPKP